MWLKYPLDGQHSCHFAKDGKVRHSSMSEGHLLAARDRKDAFVKMMEK